jgi:spore maturation protein CgeB
VKILLFWSYYEYYLDHLYAKNNDIKNWSYEKQLDKILSDYFGWPPALVKRMSEYDCEVKILIVNAQSLQKAWAIENDYTFDEMTWRHQIPIEQVKKFKPDIIWIGTMLPYFGEYLKELHTHCHKIFAWVAASIPASVDLSAADCILTSHHNFRDYFRQQGKDCEILLPAFEPKILTSLNQVEKSIDCSFIGSLSYLHMHRMQVIETLVKKTPLQIWSDLPKLISRGILNPKFIYTHFKILSYKNRINPSVWGMEMYKTLAKSQITINIHVDAASGLAGNMRMFEATGVGTLLITEDAPNIRELYEPDSEIITYKNTSELVEKINYYIDHPKEQEMIAAAGKNRTINTHSTISRGQELFQLFDRYLKI